jgi:hypothetical protein
LEPSSFVEEISIKQIYITSDHVKDDEVRMKSGNTDVIVVLINGYKYTASFLTYDYIEKARDRNKITGEYLQGKYFWAKNMVLVEDCTPEIINPVVREIIDEGEFNDVFRRL